MPSKVRRWSDRRREVRGTPWTKDEDARLAEMLRSGMCAKEIAWRMGRTVPSVVTKMSALGLRSQSQTDWQGMPWDKVRACAERGIPEKDVARVLGVRQSSLSTSFRRRFGMTYTEAGGKR